MANKFLSTIVTQSRLPECIIINHDLRFHSYNWYKFMIILLDTFLTFSMALYPQINRIIEVMNYILEKLLGIQVK